jgi:uroporphyrinogen decarboxylase
MSYWDKLSRFEAILDGQLADRPAVAAWGHFIPAEQDPRELAAATVAFTRAYDWDWIKLNPRNTYYAEAWGNTYDYAAYRGAQPRQLHGAINEPADVWKIERWSALTAAPFADQVEAARLIHQELPETPLAQTVFSPLTVLLNLAGQPRHLGGNIPGSTSTATLKAIISETPSGLSRALGEITAVLNSYLLDLARVGVHTIYYALTSTAHDELVSARDFATFSTPYDLAIIDTARQLGLRVILHTCGAQSHPERFTAYGADAVSWDHFATKNPPLDPNDPIIPVGGVSTESLAAKDVEAVTRQALAAADAFRYHPLLLAPTCGTNTDLNSPGLAALRAAAEELVTAA